MNADPSDSLFDPGERVRLSGRRQRSELDAALDLDRRPKLIRDSDGLLTREVCVHSLDKAHYAKYYADIVGRAMKNAYPGPLAWVELFAGPGELYVKDLGQWHPGSPVEAVNIPDPFDIYVFADLDERCTQALDVRVGGSQRVHILTGNANSADLHDRIAAIVPRNALMVRMRIPRAWSSTSTRCASSRSGTGISTCF